MPAQPTTYTYTAPVNRHPAPRSVSADHRRVMVAEAAYFLAERRSFAPGGELDDWLAAEREIDRMLYDVSRLPERP